MNHKTYMKLKFKRKWIDHPTGGKIHRQMLPDESLVILWSYIYGEMGLADCENHLEAIRKIRNDEIEGWGDGGNSCSSWITKEGVVLEDDYAHSPENSTLSLSLDQFEKAITGWKTFLENESLMEYEVEI
jgi:hypothetical protein